ncbi:3-phosphoserine/phosphohydroxythreonine transaminase [Colwellia sp. 4_MG-2023]|jgi:phosphoserine aminotransferase|uniref:3-phosphoserine/phosphohydroxythreonine transaminase n=1 Tax=unclassified Colwellia TaxID=196834 RepID=UPI001C0A07C5|nr:MULTISPECIES: 3-phosphoserine/phosphohydroxythreonine transaminase [unclassified Colwellia]MBU2926489.1 3-phosphoserine/phosphohydroxythreonine transaminase [Colwellia sp. C2M11]MDO6487448.1 3-phosphoserine/phosphohydroxythreonine transaminase [Colwellia sp. 6_MG-2023]MDO6508060.1 3-phosphoserine/phosphohydroxythreonine transaminase [Colwellia sp. 5_MG-2023]MDO6556761.1 3-phosphoserine/phosphohydroxythreonine transaminase [Colwellia sp. 4_MG-2023]MDO6652527.1 3-phosphoserine/phosphohydroxyt
MSEIFNFCAGPAMLPKPVMAKAQKEFIHWNNTGSSVMELSHRSSVYMAMAAKAEADLRELMAIPSNYKVLFCHGGGRGQFSAVPLNLLPPGKSADYIVNGSWSKAAAIEAQNFGEINVINIREEHSDGEISLMPSEQWPLNSDAAYVHYCPNETVDGIEINDVPDTNGIPLVADMSSTILSHEIDVTKFGVIYAGAQKNIGPSGLTIVIVREDLLGNAQKATPCIMNYETSANNDSMYNTPPTYAWYLAGLVFQWLKALGGVSAIAKVNQAKAELLYQTIDASDFYQNTVEHKYRSKMNIPFWLKDESLNETFLAQAEQQGLMALQGHRIVGGMRASIYNAMPIEGVQALVDFMQEFEKGNK